MALLMEPGSEPITENEKADLDAIAAIKESAAFEYKEKGNQYVKMGKKHYSEAIDSYTRAINQKALSNSDTSIIFANRAHVNILLGNYRRALIDAEEAIKLCVTNVKAHYRAARAAFSLELLTEAEAFCRSGLEQSPSNEELDKLMKQINLRKSERENHEAKVSKAVAAAKDIASLFETRGLRMGKAMYQELTGVRKPALDKSKILHWPVLLLYAEVMSSDFIEDFCETDMYSDHLDMMFSESSPPLPWDKEHAYTREAVELYYELYFASLRCAAFLASRALGDKGLCTLSMPCNLNYTDDDIDAYSKASSMAGTVFPLSKTEVLRYLLEGTAGYLAESPCDEEKGASESSHNCISAGKGSVKWVKVNEKKTLYDVLRQPDYVIPGIPVFYVVSKRSSFYKEFKAGNWTPPS